MTERDNWKNDIVFWKLYNEKARDYSVGPLARRSEISSAAQTKEWCQTSERIYKQYKNREDDIPKYYARC